MDGFLSWVGVPRRIADRYSGPSRGDFQSVRIRLDSKPTPLRRVYHYKFCERLERETVNYANTVGNVLKAGATRVFVQCSPWKPERKVLNRICDRAAGMLGRQMGPELDEPGVTEELSRFPPKKREMYSEGLKTELEIKRHAKCTGFVKQENVPYKPADKPRVIQFRDPVFLAHLIPAMKPLEHAFYRNRYCFNKYQEFTCAKGMNLRERMACLEEMVDSLTEPFVIDLDGSAFDAHVVEEALKLEWRFNRRAWQSAGYHPRTIEKMCKMGRAQLRNKVRFRCEDGSVSWTVKGNRMSGDLNTGLGNSELQSIYIAYTMKMLEIPEKHWRMLVDGDDAVLMVSKVHVSKCTPEAIMRHFSDVSQDVKMGGPYRVTKDSMEVIEFCQSRPILTETGWRLVRDPKKVYNGYKQQCVYYRTKEETTRFFSTVAVPELLYATGIPVHQSMFDMFRRLGKDSSPLESVMRRFFLRQAITFVPTNVRDVTWRTRDSYARAFGISALDQLIIEQEFESYTPEDLEAATLTL